MARFEDLPRELMQDIILRTMPRSATFSEYIAWLQPYKACRTLFWHAKATFFHFNTVNFAIAATTSPSGVHYGFVTARRWLSEIRHFRKIKLELRAQTPEEGKHVVQVLLQILNILADPAIIEIIHIGPDPHPDLRMYV